MVLAGCGQANELGRRAIAGQVSFRGKPLELGTVRFQPQDVKGVASGASIRDGKFEIPEEQGLPPGSYRVQLSAAAGGQPAVDPNAPPGQSHIVAKELIPPAFNSQSKLVVEVSANGENRFDFTVQ
jgi:hypothetical protein